MYLRVATSMAIVTRVTACQFISCRDVSGLVTEHTSVKVHFAVSAQSVLQHLLALSKAII